MKCTNCGFHSLTKPRAAAKTHKYAVCFKAHDEHCYCIDCAPLRLAGHKSQLETFGIGGRNLTAIVEQTPVTDAPDHGVARERLSICACGHGADWHIEDELENLLQCNKTDCGCDHFNYRIEERDAA